MEIKIKIPYVELDRQYKDQREEILTKIDELAKGGNYILGEELKSFEQNFANYCGTKYAVGVGNGTDALILALKALGIGKGDEVITPPNSFIASAGAIAAVGAKPVFVDVQEDYNINPHKIEKAITNNTKAIMPIHLTGRPAEMDRITEIANKHGLSIIEDAAQAVGALYKGRRVGSFGIMGCFSLHPLKNLNVLGDGGVITTNDVKMYEKIIKLRNHGLVNRNECDFWGYNSRLDELQAGIANTRLKKLDSLIKRRREIASRYFKRLPAEIKVPSEKSHEEAVYHRFVIMSSKREDLKKYLLSKGIQTDVHYPIPLHLQNSAKELGYKEGDFPNAERQSREILSLPVHEGLTDEQIDYIIEEIKNFISKEMIAESIV